MKRRPIERTNAELPDGDRPHPPPRAEVEIAPPNEYPFHGPAGQELRAEIDRLRARVTALTFLLERAEAHMLKNRGRLAEEDALCRSISKELNPKLETKS